MTQEEQREAIAKASQGVIEFYDGVWYYFDGKKLHPCKDNDPLQDLNAMHEAEKVLTDAQFEDYHYQLYELAPFGRPMTKRRNSTSATAAQRAEAFLKTLNLWKQ